MTNGTERHPADGVYGRNGEGSEGMAEGAQP